MAEGCFQWSVSSFPEYIPDSHNADNKLNFRRALHHIYRSPTKHAYTFDISEDILFKIKGKKRIYGIN